MSKQIIVIWGRKFELNVVYERYPGEQVLESQLAAFEKICADNAIDDALVHVKQYVADTASSQADLPIDNIFKYVMPKSVFVPHNKKAAQVALMCNYKFDMEHGIAIVFEDGAYKKVGTQDIVL